MASLPGFGLARIAHALAQLVGVDLGSNGQLPEGHAASGGLAVDWLGRAGNLHTAALQLGRGLILDQHLARETVKFVDQDDIKQLSASVGQELLECNTLGEILGAGGPTRFDIEWLDDAPAIAHRMFAAGPQLILETDAFELALSADSNVDRTAHTTPTIARTILRPEGIERMCRHYCSTGRLIR